MVEEICPVCRERHRECRPWEPLKTPDAYKGWYTRWAEKMWKQEEKRMAQRKKLEESDECGD